MKIKKTVMPIFCITTILYTHTMFHTFVPFSEQIKYQQHYPQWQKLTQTAEFIYCAQLMRLQYHPSNPELKKAFTTLHATKEFQDYTKKLSQNYENCKKEST